MSDQTLADKVRPILDEWERIKEHAEWVDMDNLVQELRALLPAPTLADMTPDERAECQRMQCDVGGEDARAVIIHPHWENGSARVLWPGGFFTYPGWERVTPRPDLPRMTWPGDTPAPALPAGWRLADHPRYGRVFVTTPEPDGDGDLWFIDPSADPGGMEHWCDPDVLTFLDDQEVADAVD